MEVKVRAIEVKLTKVGTHGSEGIRYVSSGVTVDAFAVLDGGSTIPVTVELTRGEQVRFLQLLTDIEARTTRIIAPVEGLVEG